MSDLAHRHAEPVGGSALTRPFRGLAALRRLRPPHDPCRFVVGLGAATALNDGYPWGLWIVFDVVIGTALGCGGYAVALLVYVLNKGEYHPIVRRRILTSALGYTLGVIAIGTSTSGGPGTSGASIDRPWHWNLHSVLLEVALCVMVYVARPLDRAVAAVPREVAQEGPTGS